MNGDSTTSSLADQFQKQRIQFRRIRLNTNIEFELFKRAVLSTEAHTRMLGETGIIPAASAARIGQALDEILQDLIKGKTAISETDNDIYEALERLLKDRVGDEFVLARTAKSRNDQVATDLRLFIRDASMAIAGRLLEIRRTLVDLSERDIETVMPGYTHMQPAEAILLSHWWLANEARFARDFSRLLDFLKRLNVLPLGANVLAGTREPIDRRMVADWLGFDDVIENSLDAVSDRDYLIEFGSFSSLVGLHFSQLGSELLLWVTQEFAFAKIPQHMTINTLSLPIKRNPEILEVLRARPSLIFGRMIEFIVQLKAITTGFSQDLQECVLGLADIVDALNLLLDLAVGVLPGIELDAARMKQVACADLVNVGKALDYLLSKGVAADIAARVIDYLGSYCQARHKYLSDLALSEWQQFSPAFEEDIYDYVSVEESVGAFCSFGGSSKIQVEMAMKRTRESIELDASRLRQMNSKYSGYLANI